jgi:RND family efflux transporter MFP subunit
MIRFNSQLNFPLLVAAGVLLAGCGAKPGQPADAAASLPAASVKVQMADRKPCVMSEDVVGTVRPKLSASIEAKVSGRIEQMLVVAGQVVTNGQLLARLDAAEINSRLEQASAALEQAELDRNRVSKLFDQQASTRAELDAVNARYRMAKGAVDEAKAMVSYVTVAAPFDGVITRKLADVGDLAVPGKLLLQMENPAMLRFEADVPEAFVDNVKLGQDLSVNVASVSNQISGTIAEISPIADPNSRTFLVKLDLPKVNGLRSGQFGRVAVPVGNDEVIRVPASAVVQRGQMEIIFVAANGHAQLRLVKTGRRAGNEVEIVSGLNSGENIVTDGAASLTDGQPLAIQP